MVHLANTLTPASGATITASAAFSEIRDIPDDVVKRGASASDESASYAVHVRLLFTDRPRDFDNEDTWGRFQAWSPSHATRYSVASKLNHAMAGKSQSYRPYSEIYTSNSPPLPGSNPQEDNSGRPEYYVQWEEDTSGGISKSEEDLMLQEEDAWG